MKGIVLFAEGGFVVLPHQKMVFDPLRDTGGQWRATVAGPDHPHCWFGPEFATEDEARALCRAAAVAMAEGAGGVFGEAVTEPERPLKVGDQVTCVREGPRHGARGVVTVSASVGFDVQWGDEAEESSYEWSDVGTCVTKADEPAEVEPDVPSEPKVGMRVKVIDPNDAEWGHEGVVDNVYDDGDFSVAWDDGQWTPYTPADFGKWVGPA